MKKLMLLIGLLLAVVVCNSQTIGLTKTIETTDGNSGNFFTIESSQTVEMGDSILYKVDFNLYKSLTHYLSGKDKMNWRWEVQFKKAKTFNITNYNEFLYTYSILNEPLFTNAIKTTKP